MGKIVHFVNGTRVQARTRQAVFNDLAKGRCGLRGFYEWLTFDLTQPDGFAPSKPVVTREDHDERLCAHELVSELPGVRFWPHERGIEPTLHQGVGQPRGIVA